MKPASWAALFETTNRLQHVALTPRRSPATRTFILLILIGFLGPARASLNAVEPWATYRGNPQRTGHTDGKPGPATPKVLWVHKAAEHFLASPVPVKDKLLVSGLGAFNVASFACLSTDPKAGKRIIWSKSAPYLKLPTVSSPGIDKGRLVFGDGMHQTDGAALYCLDLDKGMPLWQLPVPGTLVHLEGSPTIQSGRVYIGGGAAGVLCVDLEKATLQGKEMDLASIRKVLEQHWKELMAKYEVHKKKDPEFAVPPSEDQLPRAAPRRLWQQGQEKWHVDAPVNVLADRVLVGSAYLDLEKVGDRALFAVDAKTGNVQWKAPLKFNPWGGASASVEASARREQASDLVVVTGSSIGYDTRVLKGAKGQIVALDLAGGKEKWRKDVTGGIVSCAALADGAAVVPATDGKVRAFELANGERRWIYEAKAPLFAPVAVAANVVYAGDLKGVLHAIDLKTGQARWTLDIGTHADTKSPGMIYGGPVVHDGRIYVATCNLEGPNARQPTVVVCIGEK